LVKGWTTRRSVKPNRPGLVEGRKVGKEDLGDGGRERLEMVSKISMWNTNTLIVVYLAASLVERPGTSLPPIR
jgi:hypothetical protein